MFPAKALNIFNKMMETKDYDIVFVKAFTFLEIINDESYGTRDIMPKIIEKKDFDILCYLTNVHDKSHWIASFFKGLEDNIKQVDYVGYKCYAPYLPEIAITFGPHICHDLLLHGISNKDNMADIMPIYLKLWELSYQNKK